jgi:nitroimidazol reductase NimA-like FMN-containing flavoprotein (pyridoxamine 5'-phosphate oxidase superfamily)
MPKDYRLESTPANAMRRSELACGDDWIIEFLHQVEVGHIATRWDDQPFITPTTFWYDPDRNEIYFHSNVTGRLRANCERHPQVCFEASRSGKLLPSNVALEFSIQYESVVAFGRIRVLKDGDGGDEEKRRALYGLIKKYFPDMEPGQHYRPITAAELKRSAVYAIAVESWSGKRNWPEKADQSPDWAPLGEDSKV